MNKEKQYPPNYLPPILERECVSMVFGTIRMGEPGISMDNEAPSQEPRIPLSDSEKVKIQDFMENPEKLEGQTISFYLGSGLFVYQVKSVNLDQVQYGERTRLGSISSIGLEDFWQKVGTGEIRII